jgi:hypothetical protein
MLRRLNIIGLGGIQTKVQICFEFQPRLWLQLMHLFVAFGEDFVYILFSS